MIHTYMYIDPFNLENYNDVLTLKANNNLATQSSLARTFINVENEHNDVLFRNPATKNVALW